MPIVIYAGSDRLMKRLNILLASVRAGNNSKNILKEYTATLDEHPERNKLDTFYQLTDIFKEEAVLFKNKYIIRYSFCLYFNL